MKEIRLQLELEGRLQGVGFRPFAFRLARELSLAGWVRNSGRGVLLELQGPPPRVGEFSERLKRELPVPAFLRRFTERQMEIANEAEFRILPSEAAESQTRSAEILPDLALCSTCAQELSDPSNRRFRYPFLHCSECGPRYSILESLPFDRANTTMRDFPVCTACLAEYQNPASRRFHTQSICCADCGPSLSLNDSSGCLVAEKEEALQRAAQTIRDGGILALKGVGGFHLICDARQDEPVERLRIAKARLAKPFALMGPTIEAVRNFCTLSPFEERCLSSPGAPIVLLTRIEGTALSSKLAPGLGTLGVMLPYSALHQLLLAELGFPVVATSGNRAGEPICSDDAAAFSRLNEIADFFLTHNRRIASRVDDSIVHVVAGTEVVLRASRGYAPLVLNGSFDSSMVLGLGAQQKNALAFQKGGQLVLLPHIGDLTSLEACEEYERTLDRAVQIHELTNARPVCDLHPDYPSTRVARERSRSVLQVQHHEAHLLSCVAEHGIRGPAFGVAWDGTGYGRDGTVWGGEFFSGSELGFKRVAHLRTFRLPGGEAAVREPLRCALGLLQEAFPSDARKQAENLGWAAPKFDLLFTMMERGLNSPHCSSAGRLFDGVAALLGFLSPVDYEGQAAAELEFKASQCQGVERYPLVFEPSIVDWCPMLKGILADLSQQKPAAEIAAKFHQTLAWMIVEMARMAGIRQVILSGGCFQNRVLLEASILGLTQSGFQPYWNQTVPPNDGGLSVGQILGGRHVLIGSG